MLEKDSLSSSMFPYAQVKENPPHLFEYTICCCIYIKPVFISNDCRLYRDSKLVCRGENTLTVVADN